MPILFFQHRMMCLSYQTKGGIMKRALILCLILSLGGLAGNCATTFFPPLQPLKGADINNYSNNLANASTPMITQDSENYPNISKVENSLFGRNFTNQNIGQRLSRIEKSLFSTSYPNSSNGQRIDNIISNYNQINKYPNISTNELSKIEAKVFNQTFTKNSSERRIERLERQLLGAEQSGDINTRYETIKMASKSYNPNVNNQDDFAAPMQNRGWRGLTQALGGAMLGGQMTGFTPQIDPFYNSPSSNYGYNNYNNMSSSPYNNSYANAYPGGSGIYRGTRTNHGYSDSFQSYGSGAGVTILD